MKKVLILFVSILILGGNSVVEARQKPKPKPKAVNVAQSAQTALTQRIRKDRKEQSLTATLDTFAPYDTSSNKGVRGTGTIFTKKTGKHEMFAYDVLLNPKTGIPTRLSYRPMRGVVITTDDAPIDYKINMAQTAIRQKIQGKFGDKGKAIVVAFKSAVPTVLSAKMTQIKGEGGYTDRTQMVKFRYSVIVDSAKGRASDVNYTVVPEVQKVKR